jgi:bacterioferritin
MRPARASSACHDVAKLRTSVANDESQTQGVSNDRVDEGLRRGDNESKGRYLVVKVSYMKRPEGLSTCEGRTSMKAKEGVINILNKILTADLTAINQYFVHAKMCENWGYERLYHKVRERSFAEMKDADELIGHILYLDGVPNVQRMNTVQVGETVAEQLKLDLKAEQEMLTLLSDGVVHCTKVADFTTRHLLEDMAKDVDQHIDWIEMQMETIKQVGLENYLAEQIKKES